MNNICICVISHVHLACWQPPCKEKTLILHIMCKHFKPSMLSAYTFDLYHFTTTFSDLDFEWGIQSPQKAKVIDIIFFTKLIQIKFDVVLKLFRNSILILLCSKICAVKGNPRCFAECIKDYLTFACILRFMKRSGSEVAWRYCTLHFDCIL